MKIRINLNTTCLLLAMLSVSVSGYARAQEPSAGAGNANVTPAGTEFRLSDFLARVARGNGRHTAEARSGSLPASSGSAKASGPFFNIAPAAATGASLPVTGSGTLGRLTKWAGFTSSNSVIGDTTIFEDKYGKVGIGTDTPTSRLSVAGIIESLSGGIKFPDGTEQTTSAAGSLFSVAHDSTLMGVGTSGSPLRVAVPLTLTGSSSFIVSAVNTKTGLDCLQEGCDGIRGTSSDSNGVSGLGDTGVFGQGSTKGIEGRGGDHPFFGGDGGRFDGGRGDQDGGAGLTTFGGPGHKGGHGIVALGGNDTAVLQGQFSGGTGVLAEGGGGNGSGESGGVGIEVFGGDAIKGATKGLAGKFHGDVIVTGNLSKGGGSFKIDHPLDPENKYLYHSFVESPDMMNIYNGNVTTDENGDAVVALPDWFEALNRDFRYQLTVVGQFAQAIVASEVKNNRFAIKTSIPNVRVSWQVTGIRQDAFANKHRIPVEQDKPEKERGYYVHPDAFGQPEERSVDWAQHPELVQRLKQTRIESERTRPKAENQ
ncbi:MAG TPA: hypothetical protein VGV87_01370 [Blastocatellia bacterium]|nr:hypothetical protein [Blastocatellia bacterium]